MSNITKYLNQLIVGNVFDNPDILEAYSTDCSAIKITPKLVALPESTSDIQKILSFVDQLTKKDIHVPIAVRGSGLDEYGADLTNGIVISMEKLNHLMEFDPREKLVRVQAGITLKELNTALSVGGLMLPIGANENETIGGLIANCPTDSYHGKYKGIMNFVERIEFILANGECVQTSRLNKYAVAKKASEKTLEGSIYRKLYATTNQNMSLLNDIRADRHRSVGYKNIAYARKKDTLDLLPLMFASEGSLGVISEVIIRAVPIKQRVARLVTTFPKISTAIKFMEMVKEFAPRELNIYDLRVFKTAEDSGKNLSKITKKLEYGFVVFASFDDKPLSALKKIDAAMKKTPHYSRIIFETPDTKHILDEFENSLTNFLNSSKKGERVPFMSNFYISSQEFPNFLDDLSTLEQKIKLKIPFFGSYLSSNYSLRPKFEFGDVKYKEKAITFLKIAAFVIDRRGGSITGGSPEGRIKAIVTNTNLSDAEKGLYGEIKDIFDPNKILNPTIKLGTNQDFVIKHLRTTSSAKIVI